MSDKRFDYIWKDVKDDRGLSEIHDFFIDNFSNKEYDLSDEKDIGYFLDLLDRLSEENERLKSLHIDILERIVNEDFYQEIFKEYLLESAKEEKVGEIIGDKRFILKKTTTISSNYPLGERVYDTVLKTELYNSEIVDELNKLDFENKRLREENEKLRQILKDIVGATDETYTKNKSIYKVTVVFDGKMYNQIRRCLNE